MKNYNKDLCVLALVMILSVGNGVFAQDNSSEDASVNSAEVQQKIKANKSTISKAKTLMDSKDYAEAINYLTGYINSKDRNYEVYKLRGDAYYALRRYDLAQKDYQTAVDIKSSEDKFSTNTKYVSAIILGADKNEQLQNTELGNLYAALMYAQKAQNNPAYTLSYDSAVKYNSHIYLPAQNKADINKINAPQKYAKMLNPTGIDQTIASAISDIEKGDFHSSVFKIQNVISEYPNYYMGYYLMGVALTGQDKDDEAIKSFEKAISLNPYDFESYASLGQIYYAKAETGFSKEDSKKSVEYFTKALQYNKNCPTYYFYIGLNELNSADFNSAVRNFNSALRINDKDYNSMYYKSIAEYINGNYNEVIKETSKLILRHVSNYNSVLYLRALAYSKLGQTELALADLDAIADNIHDVFNSDIKENTPKDQVLVGYTDYLGGKLGQSAGSSMLNPIIKKLASVQRAIKPYENIINAQSITPEDYKKLEVLYTSTIPAQLGNSTFVTSEDIDNQYDFIRTTFSDLGITFVQKQNGTYLISSISDYYKKYEPKVNAAVTAPLQVNPNSTSMGEPVYKPVTPQIVNEKDVPQMAQSVPTNNLLQPGETSLAQMLASNTLAKRVQENIKTQQKAYAVQSNIQTPVATDKTSAEFKPELPDGERVKSQSVATSQEPYVAPAKQLIDDKNLQKVKGIIAEEKNIDMPKTVDSTKPADVTNHADSSKGTMVFKAEEIKPADTFKIHNEPAVVQADVKPQQAEVVTSKDGNVKISAKEIKKTPDVVVKHVPADSEEISKIKEDAKNIQENARDLKYTVPAQAEEVKNASKTKTREIQKHVAKVNPVNESITAKNVYRGLSSVNSENVDTTGKEVVELDLSNYNANTYSGKFFEGDRLGFGVGAKPVNDAFDSSLKTGQEAVKDLHSSSTAVKNAAEEELKKVKSDVEEVKSVPATKVAQVEEVKKDAVKQLQTSKQEISEVVVPKLEKGNDAPPIRLENPDTVVADATTTVKETAQARNQKSESMIKEYERLLKEKAKNEKLQKEAEALALKEEQKALKLKESEAKKLAKAEQKALELKAKEEEKALKMKALEEKKLAQAEQKAKELQEKNIEKARKDLEKSVKKAQKEKEQAQKQSLSSKIKEKFQKVEKTPQEKAAELQAKAEKKAQKEQAKLKKAQQKAAEKAQYERVMAIKQQEKAKQKEIELKEKAVLEQQKAEQKAKELQEKNIEKARKDLDKSVKKAQKEKEQAQKQSLSSRIKEKFQKIEKTPQEKAAELQAKAEKKAQKEQAKLKKAQQKAVEKAQRDKVKAQREKEKELQKAQAQQQRQMDNARKALDKSIRKSASEAQQVSQKTQKQVSAKKETKVKSSSGSGFKNFVNKLKFWKKEKPSSSVTRYLKKNIKQEKTPLTIYDRM